jgi:L-2-hydroxyglutarate oxidase LhgO
VLDVLVIGAGFVGSWIALEAARRGLSVAMCDSSARPGDGVSGRNSGVLHAGIYYAPGSLKAKHCVAGRILAEEFCKSHSVPYSICGKIITTGAHASVADVTRLESLLKNAEACGASGLRIIENPGAICPGVLGKTALLSERTGVVDVPAYLRAVHHAAEEAGAFFLPGRHFHSFNGKAAVLKNVEATEEIEAACIVNAAGLASDEVARAFGVDGFEIRPNRGEYFRLRRKLEKDILVYPLPHTDSTALGVHYTFHLNGDAYAGPNSLWAEHKEDYRVTASAEDFARSLGTILAGYSAADLEPGYSGLRPRLFKDGQSVKDFVIHRQPANAIHMLGIESPGLTSSPSLAREVVDSFLKG